MLSSYDQGPMDFRGFETRISYLPEGGLDLVTDRQGAI